MFPTTVIASVVSRGARTEASDHRVAAPRLPVHSRLGFPELSLRGLTGGISVPLDGLSSQPASVPREGAGGGGCPRTLRPADGKRTEDARRLSGTQFPQLPKGPFTLRTLGHLPKDFYAPESSSGRRSLKTLRGTGPSLSTAEQAC